MFSECTERERGEKESCTMANILGLVLFQLRAVDQSHFYQINQKWKKK